MSAGTCTQCKITIFKDEVFYFLNNDEPYCQECVEEMDQQYNEGLKQQQNKADLMSFYGIYWNDQYKIKRDNEINTAFERLERERGR